MSRSAGTGTADYRLRLDIDFKQLTWTGSVELEVPSGTDELELDSEELTRVSVRQGATELPFRVERDSSRILVGPGVLAGPLTVTFSGRVQERSLVGLYRSRGRDGYVLTTQCEPTGARRIFPCVDRPDRRARIHLTVVTDADVEVVANMPPEAVDEHVGPDGVRRRWRFAPTPPMATYLFYLGIGRFGCVENRSGRVPVRVLTPPGRDEEGRFAADATPRILEGYEQYYRIPYPLPKLDLIAVAEHAFGAMENWGAISFDEPRLLVGPDSASFDRRDVFEVIAHEVAHQWFGNLVTMRWWDDVWLNESFAAFLETKLTDRLEPTMDAPTDFFLRVAGMAIALEADALRGTHPVRAAVERPEEISQVFDEISYGKGSSVLRMLEAHLGEERFASGVREYLTRFRYGNARTEDLWRALEDVSKVPVATLVGPWIDRPGVPLVTVRRVREGIELAQERFTYDGATDEPPWPIPMTIDAGGHVERLVLDSSSRTVRLAHPAAVHANPGGIGFYRTLYEGDLFDRLLEALPGHPPADRWIVLNDLAALVLADRAPWSRYVGAAGALGGTLDRLVVEELVGTLASWALSLPGTTPVVEAARRYLAETTDRLGLDRTHDEPPAHRILRERATYARARVDAGFARELSERFVGWHRLDPDLRAGVAVARARSEGETGHRELRRALEAAPSEAEAVRLARGLAWSATPSLVRSLLDLTLTPSFNLGHVRPALVQAVANPAGRGVVGPWMREHLGDLAILFRGTGYLPLLLENAIPFGGLGTSADLRAFFREHPSVESARGVTKGLERLELFERLAARLLP